MSSPRETSQHKGNISRPKLAAKNEQENVWERYHFNNLKYKKTQKVRYKVRVRKAYHNRYLSVEGRQNKIHNNAIPLESKQEEQVDEQQSQRESITQHKQREPSRMEKACSPLESEDSYSGK